MKFIKALLFLGLILLVVVFFMKKKTSKVEEAKEINETPQSLSLKNQFSSESEISTEFPIPEETSHREEKSSTKITITSSNFASAVNDCFQGAICEIEGDPWKIYVDLKAEEDPYQIELFISFLRQKLLSKNFRESYKDVILKMIKDFYSEKQLDFQMASYYYYLGDLNASLENYLKLEEKAKLNPKEYSVPTLNIANLYFDLKQYKKALSYYEDSLKVFKPTDDSDSYNFINDRIEVIREKLR